MTRTFVLRRTNDVSGVSGLGDVAEGVVFMDGTTVLRWLRAGGSTAVYDALDHMAAIHGHDGGTVVVWNEARQSVEGSEGLDTTNRRAARIITRELDAALLALATVTRYRAVKAALPHIEAAIAEARKLRRGEA